MAAAAGAPAAEGDGDLSPAVGHSAVELAEWNHKLAEKQMEVARLKEQLALSLAEKEAVQKAFGAGARSATAQMARLREELDAVKASTAAATSPALEDGISEADGAEQDDVVAATSEEEVANPEAQEDAQVREMLEPELPQGSREDLLQLVRSLRSELARQRHEAEKLKADQPMQEEEIARLRAELTHTADVLDSTKQAARRHEADRHMAAQGYPPAPVVKSQVPLLNGGHLGVEVRAERGLRERTEKHTQQMARRAKELASMLASQRSMVQRLEKALEDEEFELQQKDVKLVHAAQHKAHLKSRLRNRSDDAVAAALGIPGARKRVMAVAQSAPPAGLEEQGRSGSCPQLPALDMKAVHAVA
eukprot:TRINITY_DN14141_c2_g1_i1.p1 TRINITY_DN14141_c2_g1~~TRINITY_DN14141_c2_g1_i1.p1  ORF type:complete len:392 (-),score=121.03 TRINITY_DN14141_c2_g1_i1:132-1220(-)